MNSYIALKKITLNGVEYAEGATIPADAVLPSRVPALVRTKKIAKAGEDATIGAETPQIHANEVEGVDLPIKTENGVLTLCASREDIVKAVETMQMKAEDAIEAIKVIESEDALIIIDACDSRATVKKAVKARAEALQAAAEENEDDGSNTGDDEEGGNQGDGSEDGTAGEGGEE